jgi:DNA polymerase-3 subunit beta
MKLTIERQALLSALQSVSGALERRLTLAVLGNVLFEVTEDWVRLTATDLEIELSALVDLEHVTIEEPGEITVPGRKWLDIVKSLPDGPIKLSLSDGKFKVSSGRSRFSLSTLPASDFPHVEEGLGTVELAVEAAAMAEMIDRTHFAMAVQDVRYYLNGMFLEAEGTRLRTVATDGHRLALAEWNGLAEASSFGVIVPRKGVIELGKVLSQASGEARLVVGSNHVRLSVGSTRFTSKLLDGKFPDYERVIPKGSDKTVVVGREAFREALQRVAILSNEKFRGVKLVVGQEGMTLFSSSPEQEEAEVFLPAEVSGAELEIGFNVQYLLDVMNACRTEKVRLSLGDVNSSALIDEVDGSGALYVVMPMRL